MVMGVLLCELGQTTGITESDLTRRYSVHGQSLIQTFDLPCLLTAKGTIAGEDYEWSISRDKAEGGRTRFGQASAIRSLSREYAQRLEMNDDSLVLPLISFYGAGRVWKQHREKNRDKFRPNRRKNGYIDALDSSANEKLLMQWLKKLSIQEMQDGKPIPSFDAVRRAMFDVYYELSGVKPTRLRYDLDMDDLQFICETEDPVFVDSSSTWSAGYKCLMTLVADIAYRMASLNPQLEEEVLNKTEGIVFIDELDLHLHPKWQKKVVHILKKAFPKIQFVVTTHAPLIIQSVQKENLIQLEDCNASQPNEQIFGKEIGQILVQVMKESDRPQIVEDLFREYDSLVDQGEERDSEARSKLDEIASLLGEEDRFVIGERARISFEELWSESDDLDR